MPDANGTSAMRYCFNDLIGVIVTFPKGPDQFVKQSRDFDWNSRNEDPAFGFGIADETPLAH